MRDTVVVFARAPRLGTVKRRLARHIGDRAALRFHVDTLTALLRDLRRCRRLDVVLAVTPDRNANVGRGPPGAGYLFRSWTDGTDKPGHNGEGIVPHRQGRFTIIPQGRGDLGERMARILRRYRRVALMGCDIPDATASDVLAAFKALGRADAVFGPAMDGGYWLIAVGPRRPDDLFGNTRWSTEHALADTLRQFRHHRVAFIRALSDVDTIEDFRRYRRGG